MRVTAQMNILRNLQLLERRASGYASAQQTVASGRRVSRASDDPFGTSQMLRMRTDLARNLQFQRNVDTARMHLGHVESSLQRVEDEVSETRALVVAASNGTWEDSDRENLAIQIDEVLESLLSEGNRRFLGRSMFSGSATDQPAYEAHRDESGTILQILPRSGGNTGELFVQLNESESVQINVLGDAAFMADGQGADSDLFTSLITLRDDLRAGDPDASEVAIGQLDLIMESLSTQRSAVGMRVNRIADIEDNLFSREEGLVGEISHIEDADLAQATMDLSMAQIGYETALASVSRVMTTSLLNFLK
jgi:flagellar hook-associated protein 3 FlgL